MTGSQIGQNLQQARENNGMEQGAAAQKLGVHVQTLSKYERGVIKKVPAGVLFDAAVLYGVTIDDLVTGKIKKAEPPLSQNVSRGTSRNSAADRRRALADQFEREIVRLGANDFEADHVRIRARSFIESVQSSGGTDTNLTDVELIEELENYLNYSLRPWVIAHMAKRGATPNESSDKK